MKMTTSQRIVNDSYGEDDYKSKDRSYDSYGKMTTSQRIVHMILMVKMTTSQRIVHMILMVKMTTSQRIVHMILMVKMTTSQWNHSYGKDDYKSMESIIW